MNIFNILKKKKKSKDSIYMDYASATFVLPEVHTAMEPFFDKNFSNPASLYQSGLDAREAISNARKDIANVIGCRPNEIYFTASGTESNNMAFLGLRDKNGRFDGMHFVTMKTEHSSVKEITKEIERLGGSVSCAKSNDDGIIDLEDLELLIKKETVMVSVMMVNNEIGTIQPIKEIASVIRRANKKFGKEIIFHTDACQAPQYLKIEIEKLGVSMLTLDSSKIYGPKGIGMLYVKKGINLKPIIFGGGQEGGLRSGTENVAGIVGFAKAMVIVDSDRKKETERIKNIRDYAFKKITENFPSAIINGSVESRIANNINVCFPGIDSEFVVIKLGYEGIECSYASTCKTLGNDNSSYVLEAIGKKDCATSSLRFTFGRKTEKEDIDILISTLKKIIA